MPPLRSTSAAPQLMAALALVLTSSVGVAQAQTSKDATGPAPNAEAGLASVMRVGMGPQTPITVLMAPSVQRELKLTDDQKTKVYEFAVSGGQKTRDVMQSMLMGGQVDPQMIRETRLNLRQENEKAIARILDKGQQERFEQIVLQYEGPLAVVRPDIAAKLRLNPAQNQAILAVMGQLEQGQRAILMNIRRQTIANNNQLNPGQFAYIRSLVGQLRDAATEQVSKLLDRKQKAQFNKLLGAPFDVAKLDPDRGSSSSSGNGPGGDTTSTRDDSQAGEMPAEKEAPKTAAKRKGRTKASAKKGSDPSP